MAEALPPLAQEHAQVAVILGGFPKGPYKSPVAGMVRELWSIHPQMLSLWVAAAQVIVNWENATRGMAQHRGPPPSPTPEAPPPP